MTRCKLLAVVALTSMLSACAQGVWVRPDTSQEEAQRTFSHCDYEATVDTRPSDIRIGGHYRHHQQSHALVDGLAEGILGAIDEGIRKSDLMRKCMVAEGFNLQSSPAVSVVSAAASSPLPVSASLSSTETPLPLVIGERSVAFLPQQSGSPLVPKPSFQPLGASVSLASFEGSRIDAARDAAGIKSFSAPVVIEERGLMTTRMMGLPYRSPVKAAFLLGACSAGDVTACILSELEPHPAAQRRRVRK